MPMHEATKQCRLSALEHLLQELKGNIRVFCRVRPELAGDAASSALAEPLMQFPSSGAAAYYTP